MKSIDLLDFTPIGVQGDFSFYLPCKIIFGVGTADRVGKEAKELGCKKMLLITDKGISKTGIVDILTNNLKSAGVDVEIYDGVVANPTIKSVEEALSVMKAIKPDGLIAVGGGSAIDTTKVIALLDTNDVPLKEVIRGRALKNPRNIPLIALETCAGTSAEITLFAPVTDTETEDKLGFGSPLLIPDVAICDPLLTLSVPARVTAQTGIDCLSHALESYVAKSAWPVSEALALGAIKLVFENLRDAVFNGKNVKAREGMLMANLMAGMAFPHSGAGMVHGFGEPLSGVYNMPHGLTIALMMPYVEKYNIPSNYNKFVEIAKVAGENIEGMTAVEAADKAITALVRINKDVGIPDSLKEAGVKKEDFPKLINKAFNHGCMGWNPILMSKEDVKNIFEQAYQGTLKDIV